MGAPANAGGGFFRKTLSGLQGFFRKTLRFQSITSRPIERAVPATERIAASTDVDVSFVMAMQTVRLLVVLFAAPYITKIIADRIGSVGKG